MGCLALPFAKSLMMTVTRVEALTKIEFKDICEPPVLDKTDLKGLPFLKGEIPVDIIKGGRNAETFSPFCLIPTSPPKFLYDRVYIIILSKVICRVQIMFSSLVLFNRCSLETLNKPFFPWVPYILTCAIRPLRATKDIILTENTIISYLVERNYGICGCMGELCPDAWYFYDDCF